MRGPGLRMFQPQNFHGPFCLRSVSTAQPCLKWIIATVGVPCNKKALQPVTHKTSTPRALHHERMPQVRRPDYDYLTNCQAALVGFYRTIRFNFPIVYQQMFYAVTLSNTVDRYVSSNVRRLRTAWHPRSNHISTPLYMHDQSRQM